MSLYEFEHGSPVAAKNARHKPGEINKKGEPRFAFEIWRVDGTRTRDPGVTGRYSNQLNYHSSNFALSELTAGDPAPRTLNAFGGC